MSRKPYNVSGKPIPADVTRAIIQLMPEGRVRLDPTVVPQIATWLAEALLRAQQTLARPDTSDTPTARKARAAHDAYLSHGVAFVGDILARLYESKDVAAIALAKDWCERELATVVQTRRGLQGRIPKTH